MPRMASNALRCAVAPVKRRSVRNLSPPDARVNSRRTTGKALRQTLRRWVIVGSGARSGLGDRRMSVIQQWRTKIRALKTQRIFGAGIRCVSQARKRRLGVSKVETVRHFAEHFLASGLAQLAHLRVNALAVRRYPRIPVFHGGHYAADLRSRKGQSFQRCLFAAKAPCVRRRCPFAFIAGRAASDPDNYLF
jgi:hypothetical protein